MLNNLTKKQYYMAHAMGLNSVSTNDCDLGQLFTHSKTHFCNWQKLNNNNDKTF